MNLPGTKVKFTNKVYNCATKTSSYNITGTIIHINSTKIGIKQDQCPYTHKYCITFPANKNLPFELTTHGAKPMNLKDLQPGTKVKFIREPFMHPNNPTGTIVEMQDLREIILHCPNTTHRMQRTPALRWLWDFRRRNWQSN